MRIRDTLIRAGRSLRQAKARTLLTSLAISVGAFTVTVALAAGEGGRAYADTLISSNGDQQSIWVFAKGETASDAPREYSETAGTTSTNTDQITLNDSDIDAINGVNGVEETTPSYTIRADYMKHGNGKKYETQVLVKADRTNVPLSAGSLNDNQVPAKKVLVSEEYIKVLGFTNAQDAIGKKVTISFRNNANPLQTYERTFTIAAVDKKATTVLNYQPALHISRQDGKEIYDQQMQGSDQGARYAYAVVRVNDGADIDAVSTAIGDKGYEVVSLKDAQESLFQFISIIQWGAAGFGLLAILASIFGIINTQYISVLERTQQIGLMKALGARRKDIGRLFRYEAAWVGFLGGAIGTLLAISTSLFNPAIAKALELEEGTRLLIFSPVTSVVLVIILMLVAVLAGYFPSRKAAKLDPIEALRTE